MINEVMNEKLFEISPDETRISIYKNVFKIPVYFIEQFKELSDHNNLKTINNLTIILSTTVDICSFRMKISPFKTWRPRGTCRSHPSNSFPCNIIIIVSSVGSSSSR